MQWQSCRTERERERLADFEEAKDGHIFQCIIFLFWQRKVPKERGGKPNKHSMSEKLTTTTVHSPPQNSMPVSYPVLKVKMHAGLGSTANGFAPANGFAQDGWRDW